MRDSVLFLTLLSLVASLASCGDGGYRLVLRFDPPALAQEADHVELAFLEDCASRPGREVLLSTYPVHVELDRGQVATGLGELDAGTYALYGRASSSCGLVAEGCRLVNVKAGGTGDLSVLLTPLAERACPEGTTCRSGACLPIDLDADLPPDADLSPDADQPADADPEVDADLSCEGCRWEGRCYLEGQPRPGSPCVRCAPGESANGWINADVGSQCVDDGADGTCRNLPRECCTGCWFNDECTPGNLDSACGRGGASCQPCYGLTCSTETGRCE